MNNVSFMTIFSFISQKSLFPLLVVRTSNIHISIMQSISYCVIVPVQFCFLPEVASRKQYRRTESTIYHSFARVVHLDRDSLCVSATFLSILKWFFFIPMYNCGKHSRLLSICLSATYIPLFIFSDICRFPWFLNNNIECPFQRWICKFKQKHRNSYMKTYFVCIAQTSWFSRFTKSSCFNLCPY